MSQANRNDRTMVPSVFTNYDDTCLGIAAIVPHAACKLLMGHAYDKARARPQEETTPRPKPALASEQTPPRSSPSLATYSPRIPQEATPSTVSSTSTNPGPTRSRAQVDFRLTQAPRWPRNYQGKGARRHQKTTELAYYQGVFAILSTAPTTTAWEAFPSGRLGYVTEPSALASALCVVEDANTGTRHLHRAQVNSEYKDHTGYKGSASPPHHT
jgi:hypothetical protein